MRETFACRHCGEAFAKAPYHALHVGRAHAEAMDADEAVAFEAARAEEEAWFRRLRKHVHSAFLVLPVFVLYVLTVTLLFQAEGNPAHAIMLFPGFVAFSALLYGMMFSRLTLKEQERKERGPAP